MGGKITKIQSEPGDCRKSSQATTGRPIKIVWGMGGHGQQKEAATLTYNMDQELASEIRNKLTAPKTALEKLAKGDKVPKEFLELALREMDAAIALLSKTGNKV